MRYIYVIRNLVNDKVYVGQTIKPGQRKASHFNAIKDPTNERPLPRSMRKHGVENFRFEVLEECADDQVDEREKHWIAHFDSQNRERGYNLAPGGHSHTLEQHRRLSEALKGNKHCVGRQVSNETKQKTGAAWRGKHLPDEIKSKVSTTMIERGSVAGENNPMFGRRGEKCPRSKLTQEQADSIRFRVSNGEKRIDIALEHNVSVQTIHRIICGKTYI